MSIYRQIPFLKSGSGVLIFMFLSAAVYANDLRIEEFSATLLRNGSEYTSTQDLGYLPATDTLGVELHLKTSWACNGNVGDTCDDKPVVETYWYNNIPISVSFYSELVAISSGGASYTLKTDKEYGILTFNLSYRYNDGSLSNEADDRNITIDDANFTRWVAERFYNGETITFQITINSNASFHVDDDDPGNNTQAVTVATLIPVAGSLKISDTLSISIDTLSAATDDGGGACPVALTGSGTWLPGSGWDATTYTMGGTCTSVASYGSGGLDLKADEPIYTGSTSGQISGLDVTVPQSELSPDSGAKPFGTATMQLPEGNTYHERNVTTGRPIPRGTRTVSVEGKDYVADYGDLTVGSNADAYLHTGVMPLYLRIGLLELGPGGLTGGFEEVAYAYDVGYGAGDFRRFYGGAPSNDLRLSRPSAGSGSTFSIDTATGLLTADSALGFDSGTGPTHYPKSIARWESFDVSLQDSTLRMSKAYGGYDLTLGSDCGSCPASLDAPESEFSFDGLIIGMNTDGGVMGRIGTLGALTKWGAYDATTGRFAFERDDSAAEGVLYLPGYDALGTGGSGDVPAVAYLMGMRGVEEDASGAWLPGTSALLGDAASRRGNGFMAGITVGPETYSDPSNASQPDAGHGELLSGNVMNVAFGGPSDSSHFYAIASNAGNKYVIRPGGVTGAFNTDAVPGPNVYGFDLDLTRFAFRQIDNILDPYTWIDGSFHVGAPGNSKGDFSIAFTSMQLECSGHVGGAKVVRSDCTADPSAPNCGETFAAWRTPIDLLTMAFDPADPSLGACTDQSRRLRVGNIVHLAALSAPLGMEAYWSSAGDPQEAVITGDAGVEIDRPASNAEETPHGFDAALDGGIAMKTPKGTELTDGWFEVNGSVALPFWNALHANARLANKTVSSPDQTIMRPRSLLPGGLTGTDDDSGNADLADKMKGNDFTAEYTWGNTGFGIALPVYYDAGRYVRNENPQFLGDPMEKDYVVLNVNSGIDFINYLRTKVSFGASADFDRLRALNMDLHIDVSDPDSVKQIDDFLCTVQSSLCSGGSGPVAGVIGDTVGRLDLLNSVAGAGMEHFFETGLREAITAAADAAPVDPFVQASAAMTPIRSLPAEAAAIVADGLTAVTDAMLDPLDTALDANVKAVYNEVPAMLFDVPSNTTQLQEYENELQQGIERLDAVGNVVTTAQNAIAEAKSRMTQLNTEVNTRVVRASDAFDAVQNLLSDAVDTGCGITGGTYDNRLLQRAFELKQRARQTADALDALDLETYGNLLSGIAGVDVDGLIATEEQIRLQVRSLLTQLDNIQSDMESALGCGSTDYSGMLTTVNQKLDALKSALSQAKNTMDSVTNAVVGSGGYLDDAAAALTDAADKVQGAKTAMTALKETIHNAVAENGSAFLPPYDSAADAAGIRSAMNSDMQDAAGYAWVDGSGETFVARLRSDLKAPVDQAIANTATKIATGLGGDVAIFAQYDAEQLKWMAVDMIMNSPVVEEVNRKLYAMMSEAVEQVNSVAQIAFDQVNAVIQDSIEAVSAQANEALQSATGDLTADIPLKSAKVDGYATIAGNNLERLHIGAEWTMSGDSDDSSTTYGAALDVTSWSANGKGAACGVADANSTLDAKISAMGLPISIGGSDATIREIYLGFMLEHMVPGGVFGGITVDGTIEFQALQLYDLAFAAGMGSVENYIGASAGAILGDVQMAAVFLVGKTCNADVLTALDPQVAEFIELPGGVFNGVYARGSASVPVWVNGCALTVGVSADVGMWVLIGPPLTIGGLMGGGAYGKALCIASLRGQVLAMGQKSGDSYSFSGEGFGVAGVGFDCDPVTWTSVSRSREDSWCGTGDASFRAVYKSGWSIEDLSTSAIH